MAVIHEAAALKEYLTHLVTMFGDGPILLDSFLRDAIEIDVDVLADGKDAFVAGVMEHIEEAGIHSGDSSCSLPPYSLPANLIQEVKQQSIAMARALNVIGLMNVQFAIKDGVVYVIEVNPRASRTVPFVAKATGVPVAAIAARLMAGDSLSRYNLHERDYAHVSVKESVFPFERFPGVDTILGPEMKSTGDAMGIDSDFGRAFAKAHLAAGNRLPSSGTVFFSVKDRDKASLVPLARDLAGMGFSIIATSGTASILQAENIPVKVINKVMQGRPHIVDYMKDGMVELVINTTEGAQSIADSFSIRRTALNMKITYSTTMSGAKALVEAIKSVQNGHWLDVRPVQSYLVGAPAEEQAA
jgi:carbamoyl-phosphate synthase large subunit